MPLVKIICLLLALCASASQSDSSLPTTPAKSSKIDSNLLLNDLNLLHGDFNFQDFTSEKSPKTPEKRNLTATCQNGANGCKVCDTIDTSVCKACAYPARDIPDLYGGCTQSFVTNCAVVKTSNICSKCSDGYYLDCTGPCPSDCYSCSDYQTCTECASGYSLYGGYCAKCADAIPHCDQCQSTSSSCLNCAANYAIDDKGKCSQTNFGHLCDIISSSDPNTCIKCASGYYWDSVNKACTSCSNLNIPNCNSCSNDQKTCESCYYGYYWNGAACVKCDTLTPGCTGCKGDGTCIYCPTGSLPDSIGKCTVSTLDYTCSIVVNGDGNSCYQCGNFYGLDTDGKTCVECYRDGYLVNTSGKCVRTPFKNCALVSDAVTCSTCGYENSYKCTPIGSTPIANCKRPYSDSSFCMECNKGYKLTVNGACACSRLNCKTCNSNDGTICDECDSGYLHNINGDCILSGLANCDITNVDGSICNTCSSTSLPDITSKCISSTISNCLIVETNDGTHCNKCKASYLIDISGGCSFSSLEKCVKVEVGGTKCNTCIDKYKPDETGECYTCSSNCADCSSPTVCTQCNANYFLYDSGTTTTCISCADSCSSCNPSPNCYFCANSIVQDGSSCRTDSIGYEMSFEDPYIILDFPHSSSKIYNIKSMKASHEDGSNKVTTNWSTYSRKNTQLKILTDNLNVNDLPINLELTFI